MLNQPPELISLGGVGGCGIADAISYIKQENTRRYPYDWVLVNQSFVLESFLSFDNFFDFDDASKSIRNTTFLSKKLNAFSIHDFNDYENEKLIVKEKYIRRFKRLQERMEDTNPILFIRRTNTEPYHPEWNNMFISEKDDFAKWVEFKKSLGNNKKIYILIITDNIDEYNLNCKFNNEEDGIFIRHAIWNGDNIVYTIQSILDII